MSLFDLPFEEPEPEPEPEREQLPSRKPPAPRERRIHTVTQLTSRLRALLEEEFFEVWVEGELSNCKVWNTGHLYFTLKDANAQTNLPELAAWTVVSNTLLSLDETLTKD